MNPIIVETDSALPLVHIAVSALTGAIEDPPGKEGLTRLTARLMRRTALGQDSQIIDERFDALGSGLGADVSHSSVGFGGSVVTRTLREYMDLVEGALASPGFGEEEFTRLKRETLAEIVERLDDDRTIARKWFRQLLFANHPYGRTSLGTKRSIEAITLDDVRGLYQQVFTQGNLNFGFAGDVAHEPATKLTERLTRNLPNGARRTDPTPEPPHVRGTRLVLVDKPERTQTQILIGGLGTKVSDEDHAALVVANTVFGGTFTARLTQEVRAKRGWSYGAYSSLPVDRRRQSFAMWTFPAAQDAAACIELELGMLRDWVKQGITQEELDWVKHYLVRSSVFQSDTAARRMSLRQDEFIYDLPPGYHEHFPEQVQTVTLEQANAAIQHRISLDDLLIVVLGTANDIGDAIRRVVPETTEVSRVSFAEEG